MAEFTLRLHFRPWKDDRLAGFVWIGRGEKPVPFPCRSRFFPSKTLHKMPSAALYVGEVTFHVDSIPSALTNLFNDLRRKRPHGSTRDVVLKRRALAHGGSKRTAHLRHT